MRGRQPSSACPDVGLNGAKVVPRLKVPVIAADGRPWRPGQIERVTSQEWSNDGKYIFYVQEDEVSKRSDKLYRHTVGSTEADKLVYDEKDLLFGIGIGRSRDKKMLFMSSYAKTMRESWYLPSDDPLAEFKLISPRREGHEYSADYDQGEFYIVTNKDAENFRVMRAPGNAAPSGFSGCA